MQNSTVTIYFKAIIWDHWNICRDTSNSDQINITPHARFRAQPVPNSINTQVTRPSGCSNEGLDIVKYKNVDRWELEREKLIMKQLYGIRDASDLQIIATLKLSIQSSAIPSYLDMEMGVKCLNKKWILYFMPPVYFNLFPAP